MTGDWTPEAAAAIELCKPWAQEVARCFSCDVYLFGSAIYEDGDQFDPQHSDLDLVVAFHDTLDATERMERIRALRDFKFRLELDMVPTLHRTNCEEPGISVIPVVEVELQANIHKSGSRQFFDRNIYLDLVTDQQSVGLPQAGLCSIADEARQALEYAQKTRNQFLAISANGTVGIAHYDGADPLPKSLARVAAQLVPDPAVGAWYDTRFGLEYLWEEVSRRRSESKAIGRLYRTLSIRRGGRGRRLPLSPIDQLLLAEILFDLAVAAPLEPVATWDIRFGGVVPTAVERERLLDALRGLVPDARVIGIYEGSVIIRLRSSKRSFLTVKRLQDLRVLPRFFRVKTVSVAHVADEDTFSEFARRGMIDRIAERISEWRPSLDGGVSTNEARLVAWLDEWLNRDDSLGRVYIAREAVVGDGDRPFHADLMLQFVERGEDRRIVVELVHLRHRSTFFQQLDRIRRLTLPTIMVVVGTGEQLASLREDIRKLAESEGALRVVPVQLNNG